MASSCLGQNINSNKFYEWSVLYVHLKIECTHFVMMYNNIYQWFLNNRYAYSGWQGMSVI